MFSQSQVHLTRHLCAAIEFVCDFYGSALALKSWFRPKLLNPVRQTIYTFAMILGFSQCWCSPTYGEGDPPANFTSIPTHVTSSMGVSSLLEYRDILIKSSFSGNLAATATYRGFALSASGAQPFASGRTHASEIVGSYSHKLPFIDIHLGAVYCRIDRPSTTECADIRVAVSTNMFASMRFDMSADVSPFGKGHILSIGLNQRLSPNNQVWALEIRASATSWNRDNFDATGWSLRLQARYQLIRNLGFHSYLGFLQSFVTNPGTRDESNGVIAGLNAVWAF